MSWTKTHQLYTGIAALLKPRGCQRHQKLPLKKMGNKLVMLWAIANWGRHVSVCAYLEIWQRPMIHWRRSIHKKHLLVCVYDCASVLVCSKMRHLKLKTGVTFLRKIYLDYLVT